MYLGSDVIGGMNMVCLYEVESLSGPLLDKFVIGRVWTVLFNELLSLLLLLLRKLKYTYARL